MYFAKSEKYLSKSKRKIRLNLLNPYTRPQVSHATFNQKQGPGQLAGYCLERLRTNGAPWGHQVGEIQFLLRWTCPVSEPEGSGKAPERHDQHGSRRDPRLQTAVLGFKELLVFDFLNQAHSQRNRFSGFNKTPINIIGETIIPTLNLETASWITKIRISS